VVVSTLPFVFISYRAPFGSGFSAVAVGTHTSLCCGNEGSARIPHKSWRKDDYYDLELVPENERGFTIKAA
jgi:hypothetical protein